MLKQSFIALGLILLMATSVHAHERQKVKPEGVMSVDIQQQGDTVHLLLGKQKGEFQSLWYQSSIDQGQTWNEPVLIKDQFKAKFNRGNDTRLAVQGEHISVVWMSWDEQARFNAGPMQMMHSSDGGQTWQPSGAAADWEGAHGFFSMAGHENAMSIVWLDNRDKTKGFQGLRYSSSLDGGQTWQANQTLDKQTCSCCWNTAKYDQAGNLYVLYRDKKPSDMGMAKVATNGQLERLSTVGEFNWDFAGCPHIGGGMAFDQQQTIHTVVGTAHDVHAGVHYQSSTDGGVNWSDPQRLGDDTAVHSDIAVTQGNQLIAAWDHMTEHGLQVVYSTKAVDSDEWSQAEQLSSEHVSATHPRVVAFEDSALVVWTEKEMTGLQTLKAQHISLVSEADTEIHVHAFDKGSFAELMQTNLGQAHVVLFWAESCGFCMKEMSMFGDLLKQGRQFNLTTVGTDFGLDDDKILSLHQQKGLANIEKWIFANPVIEALYFDVDKRWRGELPLLFLVDANGQAIKFRGAITQTQFETWLTEVGL
jgi:thiol-disulfide isomerase/thioredoxin